MEHDDIHLVVENGPDTGRRLTIPAAGARLGRSSKNDVVLQDPSMSRHHCRFFFDQQGVLHVADLGSANQTLVNGAPIREQTLQPRDVVTIGDTVLRVERTTPAGAPGGSVDRNVDLGFQRETPPRERIRGSRLTSLIALLVIALLVLAGVWIPTWMPHKASPAAPDAAAAPPQQDLVVAYEKVQADTNNIYRYFLSIDADNMLRVEIDDLENQRHVRKETRLDPDYVDALAGAVTDAGFFSLAEDYQGIQPDVYDLRDISVTVGRKTHRSRVLNRVQPDVFRVVRERLEECGKNALGLWAIEFSPEKLVDMANAAFLHARKLFEEQEIAYGNLAGAIKSLEEAEWYLETVEPKPDFYPALLSALSRAKQTLEEKYNDQLFRAERSIKLGEWPAAARELRILLEMIPDRSDPRHSKARKKLLDVEQRLSRKR